MKQKVSMLAEDTETVISFSKFQIGEWAEVYTTDKTVMKRFEKFATKHPEHCVLVKEDKYSMTFSVSPKCASLYPRAPKKVTYTEEQKQALAERMRSFKKNIQQE